MKLFYTQKKENYERFKSALDVETAILETKNQELSLLKAKIKKIKEEIRENEENLQDLELDITILKQSKENLANIQVFFSNFSFIFF